MKKLCLLVFGFVLMAHVTLPSSVVAISSPPGKEIALSKQLEAISKQTYRYFEDFTDEDTGLTYDAVRLNNGEVTAQKHTSPTNIGMYLMSTISAEEMGFISKEEAIDKITTTLHTLEEMKTWNGLYYNWYYTDDGSLMTDWGQFISTVDNGWLSAGLIVTGQAYPELYPQVNKIVKAMDYSTLYDPEVGQMRGGYDVETESYTAHHYGAFYTEPRLASYIAIGKGDVPKEHWWKMYRTMPESWDWQSQTPEGYTETYDGVEVFEGHYTYKGKEFVPSWGGSMFEALMPSLVLKEKELGKDALGLNNQRHTDIQIEYAEDQGYAAWGMSPAATPEGYSEFGATPLGIEGYKSDGTVTPHATFLALEYAPMEAFENIQTLKRFDAYGKYGFLDSVNVETGKVTNAYLALDQGMTMVSIVNYLLDGVIRDYFHQDKIGKNPEELLIKEEFSIK
ncbi:glucoamylase family protein [Halobacillus naozhouensis]|uniref:Glucoamylase family protein n=1 Tax=Halobacillus naozhouensis TaxID=554880 RepID=A0ABY8IUY4_9BACI|nr:glucoamylase family protein [Halobacillus naozhouensis]WFT73953.1 glucoamylase family protein [Halobacillus naozhouensis]